MLSPHFSFSSSSLFLLISLSFPSPGWDGNLRLMRRKSEADEKEKWGDKMCLFAYDSKFSKKNLSGQIYDIKCIFWAPIIFMVHIPFYNVSYQEALIIYLGYSDVDKTHTEELVGGELGNWNKLWYYCSFLKKCRSSLRKSVR